MKITLNGEPLDTQAVTLADMMREQNGSAAAAAAVNETFVPAAQREAFRLSEGARVEVLVPMQGG